MARPASWLRGNFQFAYAFREIKRFLLSHESWPTAVSGRRQQFWQASGIASSITENFYKKSYAIATGINRAMRYGTINFNVPWDDEFL